MLVYVHFVSPYFYHDAFMHHTIYVLDAPKYVGVGLYMHVRAACRFSFTEIAERMQIRPICREFPSGQEHHLIPHTLDELYIKHYYIGLHIQVYTHIYPNI